MEQEIFLTIFFRLSDPSSSTFSSVGKRTLFDRLGKKKKITSGSSKIKASTTEKERILQFFLGGGHVRKKKRTLFWKKNTRIDGTGLNERRPRHGRHPNKIQKEKNSVKWKVLFPFVGQRNQVARREKKNNNYVSMHALQKQKKKTETKNDEYK